MGKKYASGAVGVSWKSSHKNIESVKQEICNTRKLHMLPCNRCVYVGTQYCPERLKVDRSVEKCTDAVFGEYVYEVCR